MGPWPFFLKRNVRTTATIKVSQEKALEVLQHAPSMITLNPLVAKYEQKPDNEDTFIITDNLKFMSWNTTTTYEAKTARHDEGIAFYVKAPGGMTSHSSWTAKKLEHDADSVEVIEEANVEVWVY